MLTSLKNRKIYIASKPIDFRMSINKLSELIQNNKLTYIHDGSMYVFFNKNRDRIKIMFWDKNGFVLYYKRLDNTKFKFKVMSENIESITPDELEVILSGYDPARFGKDQLALISQ